MDRLIMRVLPAEVRARHGHEIADLLAHSDRPWRHRADVIVAAMGLRLGERLASVLVAAALLMMLAGAGLVLALTSLGRGAGEVTHHWWSSLALVGFITTLAATALLAWAGVAARAWRAPS